jgi:diguanylate cyclase
MTNHHTRSLQKRFLFEVMTVLLVITVFSGYLQFVFLRDQKNNQINVEATMIAQSIQQGIRETNLASKSIEHQIDLKMILNTQLIAKELQGKALDHISNQELEKIREQMGVSGITLFAMVDGEVKGVKATDPKEIGFSFKKYGYEKEVEELLRGEKPIVEGAYTEKNIMALPVVKSGSHKDSPIFYKYVYYHPPGAAYFINPYTEANEVYQLTNEVGADSWIQNFYKENPYVKEIGVLNMKVIEDPTLESRPYPPMKRVEHGSYLYQDPQDAQILKSISLHRRVATSIQKVAGSDVYKIFLPTDDNHLVYIAFDYNKMLETLYGHSTIILISILVSLLALFVLTARFFKRIKEAEEKIRYMAYHDELTDLPNRRMLKEMLNKLMDPAKESPTLAFLYMDMDNFKFINDTFGHSFGDELIRGLARRIQTLLAPGEMMARMGGDEFVVVLPTFSTTQEIGDAAQKILNAFISPFNIESQEVFIKPSIGISLYPNDEEEPDKLIQLADTAMYYAKKKGKGSFEFYSSDMKDKISQNVILEKELRSALDNREFELHYQPKVNIATGTIVGVEALIRWRHPKKGMIPPLDFIPFAEETGLIIPIGEWVLREAMYTVKKWEDLGIQRLQVGVNLSARQFFNENLLVEIKEMIETTGIDPRDLELEITESTIMKQPEATIKTIKEIKELGIRISMDDFGTGYSSLSYLKQIPIDTLKIDRSFVKDINKGKTDNEIIQTIISLGRSLSLEVIAEGVETNEQVEYLRAYGCDHAQGYLFGKPVPSEEFERQIRARNRQ